MPEWAILTSILGAPACLFSLRKKQPEGHSLNLGAPDNNKPELIYCIVDWWFLHPNYEFKPKELERSKYPRIEEFIY